MKKFLHFLGCAVVIAAVAWVAAQLLGGREPSRPAAEPPPVTGPGPEELSPSPRPPASPSPPEEASPPPPPSPPEGASPSGSGDLPSGEEPAPVELLEPAGRYRSHLCADTALNAVEKHIYCVLRDGYRQVAGGERTDTVFKINTAGLGITLSAEDKKFHGIDSHAIQLALWLDCSYEDYWTLSGWEYDCDCSEVRADGKTFDVLAITFKCAVLPEYAPSGAYADQYGPYATDPVKIAQVDRALQNARMLVEQCGGLSDRDKLTAYRDYICDQVEYDHGAREMPAEEKGGSPWQIANVFDNDPATNVVCQGYAKAFKYLCDLSDFSNDISCCLVHGTTTGSHMWNLIRINGQRCMADITACDSEWGRLGGLFLAGAEAASGDGFTIQCPRYDLPDGSYYMPEVRTYTYSEETKLVYSSELLTLSPEISL